MTTATLEPTAAEVALAALPNGPASSPVQTDDCPVCVVISSRAGLPPLLPRDYDQAKLWARGRTCMKLGREWTLRKFRDGFLVMNGKVIVNAFLEPIAGYYGPYKGCR